MQPLPRIRTPMVQHWRRFRYQMVPVLTFIGIGLGTWWLWELRAYAPTAVGEVEALRVDLTGRQPGTLAALHVALFDHVGEGAPVALLDDAALRAELDVQHHELDALGKQLAAARHELLADNTDRQADLRQESQRLQVDLQRLRLDLLDATLRQEVAAIDLQRLNFLVESDRKLLEQNLIAAIQYDERRLVRDALAEEVRQRTGLIGALRRHVSAAETRLAELPPAHTVDADTMLEPLRAGIEAQQARIAALRLQANDLVLRAPISGVVSAIHRHPGQIVLPGDAVATIAASQGRYIVSYLRESGALAVRPGAPVLVQLRSTARESLESNVVLVGPQIEPIPEHQRRRPRDIEWGLPVLIAMPAAAQFRPGELVDIVFLPHE